MTRLHNESGANHGPTFAADLTQEFMSNDFEIRRPDWFTTRRLRRAIRKMNALADKILVDPALAVKAPWNDVRLRSGLVSTE